MEGSRPQDRRGQVPPEAKVGKRRYKSSVIEATSRQASHKSARAAKVGKRRSQVLRIAEAPQVGKRRTSPRQRHRPR